MSFPRECTETFWAGHAQAFEFFGFVPRRISYDNTKVQVASIMGPRQRNFTQGFQQLMSHYLFEPHFCLVRQLATGEFIEHRENVLLRGNSGAGKTHLAIALGFAACSQGRKVRFFGTTDLVTQLREAGEERKLRRLLHQLQSQDLLVLDQLGYVPFSKSGAELLFEVVSRAYERQGLVITTNLPFEQWPEVCGSERMTGAMLDCLTPRVHIIEANGKSYRLRESKQRLKKKTSS